MNDLTHSRKKLIMVQDKPVSIIGIPIYQGVNLLDVAAPAEMFYWMGEKSGKPCEIYLIAETETEILTLNQVRLSPHKTFNQSPQLDLLWVPGGSIEALEREMTNNKYLDFLKRQSEAAQYVTSVCEGALLLASAGLLNGYRATTHWRFIPCLKEFSQVEVVEGYPRCVVDDRQGMEKGIRVTGGGISSGLDEALELVKRIAGEEIAQKVQVSTQYFPDPPVCADLDKVVETLEANNQYNCLLHRKPCKVGSQQPSST